MPEVKEKFTGDGADAVGNTPGEFGRFIRVELEKWSKVGRVIGQKLTELFGYQIVADNRPGAGGQIGTDIVAKAAPDGYTVLAASSGSDGRLLEAAERAGRGHHQESEYQNRMNVQQRGAGKTASGAGHRFM